MYFQHHEARETVWHVRKGINRNLLSNYLHSPEESDQLLQALFGLKSRLVYS